ncbi:hypothetical protein LCGC14_2851950, partial [marine sediment metagenome]
MMRKYMQGLYDAKAFAIDDIRGQADWRRWR